jgi:NADPH:quinone reductase-like Zn-dependent oxidoreductase
VRVVDVPTPTAKDNEVLVKVHATPVNRTDCGFRQLVRSATCPCWNSPGKHLQVPHVTLGERPDSGMSAPCRTVSR